MRAFLRRARLQVGLTQSELARRAVCRNLYKGNTGSSVNQTGGARCRPRKVLPFWWQIMPL